MARIDLTPMQSQYVDPGHVKVAEVLRARYDKTLEKKSLLDRAYSQVQVGKGDEWLVNNAKIEGQSILQDYSANGNWESGSASLAIDDATNSLLSNKGVQLGQQSYKTRQDELAFINEQRAKGNNVWDFGTGAFDKHQSYIQDESGSWKENPYQVQNELELDYNAEMSGLVQNFGKDINTTEAYIDDVYNTYVQSQVGNQDFRRLALLQLKQANPNATPEELMAMTETNIKDRLRSFTRQAEYQSTVNAGDTFAERRTILGTPTTTKVFQEKDENKSSFSSSASVLTDNAELTEEQREKKRNDVVETRETTYTDVAKKTGNTSAYKEYKKVYGAFAEQAELDGSSRYLDLFEAVNMLTTSSNSTFNKTPMGEITDGVTTAALASAGIGMVIGAGLGTVTGPLAPVVSPILGGSFAATGGLIGGAVQLLMNTGEEIYEQFTDLNNVRDWERPQEEGFISMFIDTESEQLMDEMGKLDALNKAMPGANWTKQDIPMMQKLAKSMYTYKTDLGGDLLDEGWLKEGGQETSQPYKYAAGPEGAKYRTAFNKSLKASNPEADFNLTTQGDRKGISDNWSSVQLTSANIGNPLRNRPNTYNVSYQKEGAVSTSSEWAQLVANPGLDGTSPWANDVANSMQEHIFVDNERISFMLQNKKNGGKQLNTRDYFQARLDVTKGRIGVDEANRRNSTELEQIIIKELGQDKIIEQDENNGLFFMRDQEVLYLYSEEEGYNHENFAEYVNKNQEAVLAKRQDIMNDTLINQYY
tara:strand:+ start:1655 stop:3937 length:2283 start_codon:yes stop_codon:yes gene_type:complete